jgi:hypothetical protein
LRSAKSAAVKRPRLKSPLRVADHADPHGLQLVHAIPVCDGRAPRQEATGGDEEGAGAHGGDPRAGGVALRDDAREDTALDLGPRALGRAFRPAAAGDHEQLGPVAQLAVRDHDRAPGGGDAVRGGVRHQGDVESGLRQHLVRAERVELVEAVVDRISVRIGQTPPGARSVISCSRQRLPSGSLNDAYVA